MGPSGISPNLAPSNESSIELMSMVRGSRCRRCGVRALRSIDPRPATVLLLTLVALLMLLLLFML